MTDLRSRKIQLSDFNQGSIGLGPHLEKKSFWLQSGEQLNQKQKRRQGETLENNCIGPGEMMSTQSRVGDWSYTDR